MMETAYQMISPEERAAVDRHVQSIERFADENEVRFDRAAERVRPDPQDPILSRRLVKAALTERIKDTIIARGVTPQRVLQELSALAFSRLTDVIQIDPLTGDAVYDVTKVTPLQAAALKKFRVDVEVGRKRTITVEMHDKIAALRMLVDVMQSAETSGMFSQRMRDLMLNRTADITVEQAADEYQMLLIADRSAG